MSKYVAAIDQGTTSTRFIVFDHDGNAVVASQKEHQQIYPKPGWVEHDPLQIWERMLAVMTTALERGRIVPEQIVAVGVTNQRETTVVWDRRTGKPIHNAIVWQDTRTDEICGALAKQGGQDRLRAKTGLPLATYFSGPKIKWILENVSGARKKADNGDLLFGTIDSWLIWNLTGEHVTDVTNASRTLLMNLETLDWDDEILKLLGIPRAMLPRIKSSSEIYGRIAGSGDLPLRGVPVAGDLGDQQAALFGQTCYSAG
ncbi:MAG: glycerol kinase, partial [Anaerolineae bacterium]|nr:glycerol kinase [Anaerolineae bacterium]